MSYNPEIATREPEGSEWSISWPALALPPPTGTAARPSCPSGALHTSGAALRHGRRPARSPSALRASLGASP